MTVLPRKRKSETLIYTGMWVAVVVLFFLDRIIARSYTTLPMFDVRMLFLTLAVLIPFFVLFLISNYILIPRLLFRDRFGAFVIWASVSILAVLAVQYMEFYAITLAHDEYFRPRAPHPGPKHLLPLPVLLDFVYDLLVIGANLTIALLFQRFEDKFEKERLLKANAENRLEYLKAQINPHFYMNMLNNIHGMIEINPETAQGMVIEMSNLMRYMLYESSQPKIALSQEIGFLKNYLSLMRSRYPENRVEINAAFPTEKEMSGIRIPPLLYLVFIENAFKHGVSYREKSFISIYITVNDDEVAFTCVNSNHQSKGTENKGGIGLKNVEQRLRLIYSDKFTLNIATIDSMIYSVALTIPAK